jgi:peptide/nickel transport system permease protein
MNERRGSDADTAIVVARKPRKAGYAPLWMGGAIVGTMLLFALFPSSFANYSPEQADPLSILLPPSAAHPMGTDINGMDIWSRVVWAARIDLLIALSSTLFGAIIGTLIGTWAGYYFARPSAPGWVAEIVMRAMDMLQAFPIFIIALAAVGMSGRSISNVVWVLIVLQVPIFARLSRSEVVRIRSELYVDAARCAGNSDLGIMFRHILPNSITPNIINASTVAGSMILLTAGLSFAGAGVPAPTAEWGYMVSVGAPNLFTGQWWPAFFPGFFIGVTVLGFSLLGEGVRTFLDRRLQ